MGAGPRRVSAESLFNDECNHVKTGYRYYAGWDASIYPYIKSSDVFTCPDSTNKPYKTDALNPGPDTDHTGPQITLGSSYRYNASNQTDGAFQNVSLSQFDSPAQAIIIAEGSLGVSNAGFNALATWDGDLRNQVCKNFTNNAAFDIHAPVGRSVAAETSTTPEPQTSNWGQGLSNYVFADGHCKALRWNQTWERIAPDTKTANGANITPTMWRQNFQGVGPTADDFCGYVAP